MTVGWLIDGDMFPHYRDALVAAIQELGHRVKLIHAPSPPFRWDDIGCSYQETFPQNACVVAHGDIELVSRIYRERRWTPGVFATIENYHFAHYVCQYGRFVLNGDYVMLPFGELSRRQQFLFDTFGRDHQIFIRPDSPLKLFTGQVASRATFAADLEFMAFYEFPASSLVVVSSPKRLTKEWRFVVARGSVIAGCQYRDGDAFDRQPRCDENALALAKAIAAIDYEPDPVWVMDICQTDNGEYHLLEIGGFSFADLYACNMNDVVAGVSAAAHDAWSKCRT